MLRKYEKTKRSTVAWAFLFAFALLLAGCNGEDDDDNSGRNNPPDDQQNPPPSEQASVSGTITEYATGEPVSGARVQIVDPASNTVVGEDTTNSNGDYTISNIGFADGLVVTAVADGYAPQSKITSTSQSNDSRDVDIALQTADLQQTFDPGQAQTLSANGINLVELTQNAFETEDGGTPVGDVTATLEIIDPSGDPSVLPGTFRAEGTPQNEVAGQDNPTFMQSFGAVVFRFVDEAGNPLDLAPGESATIRIPVADDRDDPPQTIPLFFFDPETGVWREAQGIIAQLVTSNGKRFYKATVQHFSTWNADFLYESVYVKGCVVDGTGDPVAGALVTSQGVSYIGSSSARTNEQGEFSIPVKPDSQILLTAAAGGLSSTKEVTVTSGQNGQPGMTLSDCLTVHAEAAKITLTWEENPRDLDSHLCFTNPDGTQQYHVYFNNLRVEPNGAVVVLDHDDVSGIGPEVTTIRSIPFAPGDYRFLVHKYAGSGTIASSPARVVLEYGQAESRVFAPAGASGSVSRVWHVFTLHVDNQGTISVEPVNEFLTLTGTGGVCEATSQTTGAAARRFRTTHPQGSAKTVPQKQYAQ